MYGMQVPDFSLYNDYKDFFNPPNYGTAKAGVIHLTKYYAKLLAKDNILVNSVSPGPFPSNDVQKEVGFIKELEKAVGVKDDAPRAIKVAKVAEYVKFKLKMKNIDKDKASLMY